MNVLVTGANGFLGRHIIDYLVARGHQVRAAARTKLSPPTPGVTWVPAPDLGPDADWTGAVAATDVVIHCAARVHVMNDSAADPLAEFRRVNCEGTLALAKAAAAARVKRFIFLSSIKVNGESTSLGRPFRARDEPRPLDPYGISKLEAEKTLRSVSENCEMEVVIVRPVLVYGPGVGANFRIMMRAVATGMPLPLGAADNRRSMLFVGNLASFICRAAEHPRAAGQVFLLSDGRDLSTTEMLRLLANAMGKSARLLAVPPRALLFLAGLVGKKAVAQRLLGSLAVDVQPSQEALEWAPPFSVEQGFRETVIAYLSERRRVA